MAPQPSLHDEHENLIHSVHAHSQYREGETFPHHTAGNHLLVTTTEGNDRREEGAISEHPRTIRVLEKIEFGN